MGDLAGSAVLVVLCCMDICQSTSLDDWRCEENYTENLTGQIKLLREFCKVSGRNTEISSH